MKIERYIAAHEAGRKNPKHAAQWPDTLSGYVYPVLSELAVQAVEHSAGDEGDRTDLDAGCSARARPARSCAGVAVLARGSTFGVGRRSFYRASDRDALLRPARLCGIELPIALFDAAGPLEPGNRGTDMVRANAFACSGDFLLRLAG